MEPLQRECRAFAQHPDLLEPEKPHGRQQGAHQRLEKTLLREVETAYLDAVSAQSQYTAAVEKRRYAQESYDLTDEQFRVGMKNTVELITAQNELSSARLEVLQAKYVALLNMALLDIYQGRPVTTI